MLVPDGKLILSNVPDVMFRFIDEVQFEKLKIWINMSILIPGQVSVFLGVNLIERLAWPLHQFIF